MGNDDPKFMGRNVSPATSNQPAVRVFVARLWSRVRPFVVNRYLAFFLFMLGLSELLRRMSELSGIRSHLRFEAPLLLALYWALNFALRPGKLTPFVAALPFVLIYTAYDIFFLAYGDIFRVIDFRNLPELMWVLPLAWKAGLVLTLLAPVALVLCFLDYRRYRRTLAMAGLATVFFAGLALFPGAVTAGLDEALNVTEYSDAQSVNENGRFTMMVYFEALRRSALADTALYRNRSDYPMQVSADADFLRTRGNHRNVHLVVLESWVDPTLFAGVTFSQSPRHPDFDALVGDRQSFSISPVFGGQTAQAEFEVLCGVPALHRLSSIEFNAFSGNTAGCMPSILASAGYSTMVSNAFEPDYFNSTKAYTGIGFQNIYFPAEYANARPTYFTLGDVSETEAYMFDGDLFDQNLAFVARRLQQKTDKPILNYLLGIYGHEPHIIDTKRRPLVISEKSKVEDEQLLRSANQYWYRTQAIARFVRGLIKLDPHSLIIIVSDHLPPLDEGVQSYKDLRYLNNVEDSTHLNRILVVENGVVVRHETIHHYQVPSLIYNYLTSGEFCASHNCAPPTAALEERYMALISHAVDAH